jgi:hypothetical protein
MKRINKSLSKEYIPVKLFLDELESIEEFLSIDKSGYKIETENLEFLSIEELRKKYQNESITNLKISSTTPLASIEFNKLWTRLYVGSDSNSESGLFYKLDKIILTTTRKPSFLYSRYTLSFGYIGFMFLKLLSHGVTYQIFSILNYLLLAWILWVIYVCFSKHSEIVLSKRHDIKGFLARNKDQIIINFFTTSIGFVLGILGTIITYKMGYLK